METKPESCADFDLFKQLDRFVNKKETDYHWTRSYMFALSPSIDSHLVRTIFWTFDTPADPMEQYLSKKFGITAGCGATITFSGEEHNKHMAAVFPGCLEKAAGMSLEERWNYA